jgi:CheY-like chemotaxis protein
MKKYHATIMVVEDDPNDQFLIVQAFKKNGVTDPIQVVGGGAEAIAYMMGEGKFSDRQKYAYPTFIITDLKMPKGDGFTVLEFLKGNPQWKVIPTIVLSASSDPDDIKKSYMLGASSYHVKPQSQEELQKYLAVINAYWMTCQVPEVDSTGKQLVTDSAGKLGERFPQDDDPARCTPEKQLTS